MDSLRIGDRRDHEILLRFAPRLGIALSIDGIHSAREPRRLAVVRHVLALGGSHRVLFDDGKTASKSQVCRLLSFAVRSVISWLQPAVGELCVLALLHRSVLLADLVLLDVTRQDHPCDDIFCGASFDVRIFFSARIHASRRVVRIPAQ